MKRAVVACVVVLLLLLAGLVALYASEAGALIEAKRAEAAVELPRLIAETEYFAGSFLKDPLFEPMTGEDAGPWLNPLLGLEELTPPLRPLITDECRRLLDTYASREGEIPGTALIPCDTQLFIDAQKYGRWSFNAGPRASLPEGPRTRLAMARLIDLQPLAKIHMLKGVVTNRRAESVAEVRHFARLLFSGEYLVNVMFGIALLRIEHRISIVCGQPTSLEPVRLEALKKRVFAMMFANNALLATDEPWRREPRFFRCTAITELAFMKRFAALPEDAGCWLENARYEMKHPYQQPPEDPFAMLSAPAALGGQLAHLVGFNATLEGQLIALQQLPPTGQWSAATSPSLERLVAK
ncbi:MAG: hypothetical protein ACO1OB_31685 [Archangium sp.]